MMKAVVKTPTQVTIMFRRNVLKTQTLSASRSAWVQHRPQIEQDLSTEELVRAAAYLRNEIIRQEGWLRDTLMELERRGNALSCEALDKLGELEMMQK